MANLPEGSEELTKELENTMNEQFPDLNWMGYNIHDGYSIQGRPKQGFLKGLFTTPRIKMKLSEERNNMNITVYRPEFYRLGEEIQNSLKGRLFGHIPTVTLSKAYA